MHNPELDHSIASSDRPALSDTDLHVQANQFIHQSNELIFQKLPAIMSQIIANEIWTKQSSAYKNFGEYALSPSPDGLGIKNNDMLWLLKSAMNANTRHSAEWADVLDEVDSSVRSYARKQNIPVKELQRSLTDEEEPNPELSQEDVITYLPSRSKSNDGQLLKLKKKDPEAYEHVIQGKMPLKEALPRTPKKLVLPIESVKNKFTSLSKSDREAFLAWIEQEKENLI